MSLLNRRASSNTSFETALDSYRDIVLDELIDNRVIHEDDCEEINAELNGEFGDVFLEIIAEEAGGQSLTQDQFVNALYNYIVNGINQSRGNRGSGRIARSRNTNSGWGNQGRDRTRRSGRGGRNERNTRSKQARHAFSKQNTNDSIGGRSSLNSRQEPKRNNGRRATTEAMAQAPTPVAQPVQAPTKKSPIKTSGSNESLLIGGVRFETADYGLMARYTLTTNKAFANVSALTNFCTANVDFDVAATAMVEYNRAYVLPLPYASVKPVIDELGKGTTAFVQGIDKLFGNVVKSEYDVFEAFVVGRFNDALANKLIMNKELSGTRVQIVQMNQIPQFTDIEEDSSLAKLFTQDGYQEGIKNVIDYVFGPLTSGAVQSLDDIDQKANIIAALADHIVGGVRVGDYYRYHVEKKTDFVKAIDDYLANFTIILRKETAILTNLEEEYRFNKNSLRSVEGLTNTLDHVLMDYMSEKTSAAIVDLVMTPTNHIYRAVKSLDDVMISNVMD